MSEDAQAADRATFTIRIGQNGAPNGIVVWWETQGHGGRVILPVGIADVMVAVGETVRAHVARPLP